MLGVEIQGARREPRGTNTTGNKPRRAPRWGVFYSHMELYRHGYQHDPQPEREPHASRH